MPGQSASLLTKTQRRRLRNEFEDVDEDAKRRDQQLIRERIRSGILDFQLLTDYPDSQYERAFDDISDETLRAALADTYLAAERLRDLRRYDREQLLTDARARAETVSAEATDVRSLDRLDLRSAAAVRRQTESDLEDRFEPGRWETRATGTLKLASGTLVLGLISLFMAGLFTTSETPAYSSWMDELGVLFAVVALLLSGIGGAIISLHAVRYDIIPGVASVVRRTRAIGRTALRRWESDRAWLGSDDDHTARWKRGETWGDASASSTDDKGVPPLDRLRRRYAEGDLTDEQFERKLERLLATESLEDAEDRLQAQE